MWILSKILRAIRRPQYSHTHRTKELEAMVKTQKFAKLRALLSMFPVNKNAT